MTALTKENWQEVVREAIQELPAALHEFLLYSTPQTDQVVIQCGDGPGEGSLELTYWKSSHEKRRHEQENRKPGDYVNPYEEEMLDAHGGMLRKQLDWPGIASLLKPRNYEYMVYIEKPVDAQGESCSVAEFRQQIQVELCETLFDSGLLSKDSQGQFLRLGALVVVSGVPVQGQPFDEEDEHFEE